MWLGSSTTWIGVKIFTRATVFLIVAFLSCSVPVWAENNPNSSCVTCHSDTADENKGSVHLQQGISCQNCHGGDPAQAEAEAAHSKEAGFVGVPDKPQIAQLCGSCHADVERMNFYGTPTDQLARYKTSHHGKKLFLENDTKVAVCSDCHGYHNVIPVGDPNSPVYPLNVPKTCDRCHGNEKLMAGYHLPSDIFKTYQNSVHGKALLEKKDSSVAQCVSCHGSHGAVPPGVKDVATTCGKCHVNEKKYFLESVHAKAQAEGKFSECISCHGNHGVEPATPALFEKACIKCHDAQSAEARLGVTFKDLIAGAQLKYEKAGREIKQASIDGFFVEPEQAELELMKTDLIGLAPLQHTLSAPKLNELDKKIEAASQKIHSQIQKKRDGLQRRKIFLAMIWAFIIIMVCALWAKYKQLKSGKH